MSIVVLLLSEGANVALFTRARTQLTTVFDIPVPPTDVAERTWPAGPMSTAIWMNPFISWSSWRPIL